MDLKPLAALNKLRVLRVRTAPVVTSLAGIEALTGLEELSISAFSLINVENLLNLSDLVKLCLGAPAIDLSPVRKLANLKHLELRLNDFVASEFAELSMLEVLVTREVIGDLSVFKLLRRLKVRRMTAESAALVAKLEVFGSQGLLTRDLTFLDNIPKLKNVILETSEPVDSAEIAKLVVPNLALLSNSTRYYQKGFPSRRF